MCVAVYVIVAQIGRGMTKTQWSHTDCSASAGTTPDCAGTGTNAATQQQMVAAAGSGLGVEGGGGGKWFPGLGDSALASVCVSCSRVVW